MTEIPGPPGSPEPQRPPEQLQALGAQFAADLEEAHRLKLAIIERDMGPEEFNMYQVELEMADENPELDHLPGQQSPYEAAFEQRMTVLDRQEHFMLQGGVILWEFHTLMTPVEHYTTADGQGRARFTEYGVQNSVIVADHHDFTGGETWGDQRRRIEIETQANLNGQPLPVDEAEHFALMLHTYRSTLERLVESDEATLAAFLRPPEDEEGQD